MDKKWPIITAIILGIAAVLLTNFLFRQQEARRRKEATTVLVAAQEIPEGTIIDYSMLAYKMVPYDYIQPGAMQAKEQAVGKKVIVGIMPGEQVLTTKLSRPTGVATLATQTPAGKRAVTISLDMASAVGGMIRPRDHIDIIAIFNKPPLTLTLFQNILVLAVGTEVAPEPEGRPRRKKQETVPRSRSTITLALSPQQVQVLNVAMEHGKLRLTLRPRAEQDLTFQEVDLSRMPATLDLNTLIRLYARPKKAPPTVEVIRGLESQSTAVSRKK